MLVRWFGLSWWKVALAAAVHGGRRRSLSPAQPLIPFAVAVLALSLVTSDRRGEGGEWFAATWEFAKQILPLLLVRRAGRRASCSAGPATRA